MNEYLVRELDYELMRMPYWIDVKSPRDYITWKKLYKCNVVLASLFTTDILTDEEIEFLVYQFSINYQKIDKTYELDIAAYYNKLLSHIMSIVVYEEEYTIAANLKKMTDRYFNDLISISTIKN